jgi:hypothetical protein
VSYTPMLYRYKGRRADGNASTGSTSETPLELTERLFNEGWRELVVLDSDTEVVGAIEKVRGKRTWWAEDF